MECGLLSSESSGVSRIIDIQRYSSYGQLVAVTAYVLRFIERMRGRVCETFKELAVLMEEAEVIWIKGSTATVVGGRNFKQWRAQLQLFVDGAGIWRCGGRLTNADISYQAKHPILLPGGR